MKSKHMAIVLVFGILIYFLIEALKAIFTTGFQNTNYALIAIALILLVICVVTVYVIRTLSKEDKEGSS